MYEKIERIEQYTIFRESIPVHQPGRGVRSSPRDDDVLRQYVAVNGAYLDCLLERLRPPGKVGGPRHAGCEIDQSYFLGPFFQSGDSVKLFCE